MEGREGQTAHNELRNVLCTAAGKIVGTTKEEKLLTPPAPAG